ncbi:MAG: hypothetical protein ACLSAF_21975 [Intestinimonas sp.]
MIIAVLCAIGVAGRGGILSCCPSSPAAALTIIAGRGLRGETGFSGWARWTDSADVQRHVLPGAVDALADVRHGHHRVPGRRPVSAARGRCAGARMLAALGALAAILIYGGIMNSGFGAHVGQ